MTLSSTGSSPSSPSHGIATHSLLVDLHEDFWSDEVVATAPELSERSDRAEAHRPTLEAYPFVFDLVDSIEIAERRAGWDASLRRIDHVDPT